MKTTIALLRGINVGGRRVLPMKELVAILESLSCHSVRTYIQSGNAVFESEEDAPWLEKAIGAAIRERHGFEPHVLVLKLEDIEGAIAENPFSDAEADPRSLHIGFLATVPEAPDLATMDSLKKESERYRLIGKRFYLHAPEGVGRSALAANAEKLLGVPMTDRNWRTVCEIRAMATELGRQRLQDLDL
ncbi:MAG: DUF1697 domain-containing protein [Anaerolineae bacterium]|jgi:uncharacterized protein (DUF1697 family)|nr:DUF1697 domain-containing protein [Anaerolineae bacterium]